MWDWNGTLIDDAAACVAAINRMLHKRKLPTVEIERYREVFGFPVKDYYLSVGFDLDSEDWDAIAREYHVFYADTSKSARLRKGSVDALERLKASGKPMSVLSACEMTILERMLKEHGVRSYFERVYGLNDLFASSKLSLARSLMSDVGVKAGDVLLVGDTLHDGEVARELGFQCVMIEGGHQSRKRLEAAGYEVMSDFAELF